jgi:hypothetical protein
MIKTVGYAAGTIAKARTARLPPGGHIYGRDNTFGGYSTSLVVARDFVLKISRGLKPEVAAPILCPGAIWSSPDSPGATILDFHLRQPLRYAKCRCLVLENRNPQLVRFDASRRGW